MTDHEVIIAGGGPSGLTLAGELALAGVNVAIVERRPSQDVAGSRAGGLHSRTLEVFDQRGSMIATAKARTLKTVPSPGQLSNPSIKAKS
jgi:2-polyprenyl-6-methoxyphenol hydroxylase-like FAD-dependent oxidoreductase